MDQVAAGGAFEALVEEFSRRIAGLVRKHLGDPSLTEDIVQETFLRAFRSIEGFDSRKDPWPWLSTIAVRLCRDHSRLAGRRREHSAGPDFMASQHAFNPQRTELGPDELLVRSELCMSVREALARLNPSQQRLLYLCDAHGVEPSAMAESEEVKAGTLRTRLSRARQAFRHAYATVMEERGLEVCTLPVLGPALTRWRSLRARLQELCAGMPGLQSAASSVPAIVAAGVVIVASSGLAPSAGLPGERRSSASEQVALSASQATVPIPDGGRRTELGTATALTGGGESIAFDSLEEISDELPANASVAARRDQDVWVVEEEDHVPVVDDEAAGTELTVACESGSVTTRTLCDALDSVAGVS